MLPVRAQSTAPRHRRARLPPPPSMSCSGVICDLCNAETPPPCSLELGSPCWLRDNWIVNVSCELVCRTQHTMSPQISAVKHTVTCCGSPACVPPAYRVCNNRVTECIAMEWDHEEISQNEVCLLEAERLQQQLVNTAPTRNQQGSGCTDMHRGCTVPFHHPSTQQWP